MMKDLKWRHPKVVDQGTWRQTNFNYEYQPSSNRGTRSPPATPHRPTWPTGTGEGFSHRLFGASNNFRKIGFQIRALLLWEKVATEEKREKKGGEKKNDGNSGHQWQLTATLTSHANIIGQILYIFQRCKLSYFSTRCLCCLGFILVL